MVTMVADKLRRLWLWENVNGLRQSKQETDPYRSPYNHNPSHHTDKLDVCGSHLICQVFPKLEDRCDTFLMHACYESAIYLYIYSHCDTIAIGSHECTQISTSQSGTE